LGASSGAPSGGTRYGGRSAVFFVWLKLSVAASLSLIDHGITRFLLSIPFNDTTPRNAPGCVWFPRLSSNHIQRYLEPPSLSLRQCPRAQTLETHHLSQAFLETLKRHLQAPISAHSSRCAQSPVQALRRQILYRLFRRPIVSTLRTPQICEAFLAH
jgi:hypothetical protein